MATRISAALALAWLVASCSPYVYRTEITDFSNGVNAVAASYDAGRASVANGLAQEQQKKDMAARARLDLTPGCDAIDGAGAPPKFPDCAVVAVGAVGAVGAAADPAPAGTETALAKAAPAFTALSNYAAALAAVTNAADDAALTQAAQDLAASATGLTSAVAKQAPAAASQSTAAAAGGVLGELTDIYLDSRRLDVLRAEVPAVDGSVAVLGKTVSAALVAIRSQQLHQMTRELHAAAAPFQSPAVASMKSADYQSALAALEAKVGAFSRAREADPRATVAAMVDAHHQLATALANGAGQSQAVYAAASSFSKAAAQLASAATPPPAQAPAKTAPAS